MASSKVIGEAGSARRASRPDPSAARRGTDADRLIRRAQYLMARRIFPTDSALADAVGVHRSQITRWKAGDPASPEHAWLLRDLAFAAETASGHFLPETAYRWILSRNLELEEESPLEAIRGGRLATVLMVLQAQTNGSFY